MANARPVPCQSGTVASKVMTTVRQTIADRACSAQCRSKESSGSSIQYGSHEVEASDDSIAHRFTASADSDADVPHCEFSDDFELLPLDDGRVTILDSEGDFVGGIEAPWAVDAEGNKAPT